MSTVIENAYAAPTTVVHTFASPQVNEIVTESDLYWEDFQDEVYGNDPAQVGDVRYL